MKKYKCNTCDYIYDEAKGEPERGIVAMTEWNDLPLERLIQRVRPGKP